MSVPKTVFMVEYKSGHPQHTRRARVCPTSIPALGNPKPTEAAAEHTRMRLSGTAVHEYRLVNRRVIGYRIKLGASLYFDDIVCGYRVKGRLWTSKAGAKKAIERYGLRGVRIVRVVRV